VAEFEGEGVTPVGIVDEEMHGHAVEDANVYT
jgi:hypothetical protein